MSEPIGFIGLGVMGRPMALNLVRGDVPLVVWSRTAAHGDEVVAAGAQRAGSAAEVFARCRTVLLMLATDTAIDAVLERDTEAFARHVAGHVVVHMGTTSPGYSAGLADDVAAAGGRYVEAPVSGSRVPAERGELIAMLAGPADAVAEVRPVLAPTCRELVDCGAVPGALTMKLAVNLYLVTTVAALAEATHFAQQHGLDLATFASVVNAGQTASPIARLKLQKLQERDFAVQAAIADVRKNSRLVAEAARAAGVAAPIVELADELYLETVGLGFGDEDMAAVIRAHEARTASARRETRTANGNREARTAAGNTAAAG
jgi:3-hydroxyisobutyrate dehydrogenase